MTARRLGIEVRAHPDSSPVPSAAYGAVATVAGGLQGFGSGATPEHAADIAVIECAERWAQFAQPPRAVVHDTFAALGPSAVSPLAFGLYADDQYARPGFPFAPFDERAPLDWVEARDVHSGEPRLVPLELVHPAAPLARQPVASETSNGTAMHLDADRAVTAAICEAVERDAVLVLWHRRPPTGVIPASSLPDAIERELTPVRRAGHVVLVCRLACAVELPTFLIVALRGTSFSCGAGTHADPAVALAHAVAELGADLRASARSAEYVHLPLGQVRTPAHHRALYDRGPLHTVLRAALDASLVSAGRELPPPASPPITEIAASGLHAYACDLTPPELQDCGVHVARALVPGLVPLSFGHDRLRLGCGRLAGDDAPGRLVTLLPHPLR